MEKTFKFEELKKLKLWNRIPEQFKKDASGIQEYLMTYQDIECEALGDQDDSIIIYS